jgi:hypothetical protein
MVVLPVPPLPLAMVMIMFSATCLYLIARFI